MLKKILMIDDDPDFRAAIKAILTKANYECVQAESMRKGIEIVSDVKPDLIILDVMMEDISAGFRFLKILRDREMENKNGHIPILMVTNIQKITDLDFREQIGKPLLPIDGFLDKPVEPNELLKDINALIK